MSLFGRKEGVGHTKEWYAALNPDEKVMFEYGRLSVLKDFDTMCKADGMVGFSSTEWAMIQRFFAWNKRVSGWDKHQTI